MDFCFDLNDFVSDEMFIVKSNLQIQGFVGSAEAKKKCADAIGEVLDKMGLASALAQGLSKPITSAIKMKNSEHIAYVIADLSKRNSIVIGFLKVGWKDLFIFNTNGMLCQKNCLCVLDFYVHESMQRLGYGKCLYDFMLEDNALLPQQLPIDRPSDKLLQFLFKHYHLKTIIPQSNNFVIFQEYFDNADIQETVTDSTSDISTSENGKNVSIFDPFGELEHSIPRNRFRNAHNALW